MTHAKRIFSVLLGVLKRMVHAVRSHPFGVLAALCGVAAATLAVFLPWSLPKPLNDLNLAVAKQLAGTGAGKIDPIRAAALTLLIKTACVAALYLASIWCALRCARSLRVELRGAVNARRAVYEAEGHTPPPDWEKEVGRDIDHISAMVAAAPEWLMVIAGAVFCVMLLLRTPPLAAIWIPVTAVAVCAARDILRRQRVPYAVQTAAMAALWCVGTLMMVLRAVQPSEPGIPLGTLVLLLLGMAVIVPAVLQAPYRNLHPAWSAYRRVRNFLK